MSKLNAALRVLAGTLFSAAAAFAYAEQVPDGDLVSLQLICGLLGAALLGASVVLEIKRYLRENP